jgi:phosphoribosylanthranilate isomerase
MFVKICGVTTVDDALLAAGLGADAVGMIFAASSRRVSQGEARDIARRLPGEVVSVGVFRNERRERVVELANTIGLRAVQLHGQESPEDTRWVAERVPIVIRAFAATDPALARAADYGPVWLHVESSTPGSGQVFDWAVLEEAPLDRPFILAGGLDPGNVADAVETVRPWGIDVATGVEASPGRKDPARLRRFLAEARAAAERVERAGPAPWDRWADPADSDELFTAGED